MGVRNQSLTLSVSTVRNLLLGSKGLTFTEMLGVFNPLIYEGLNTPTTKPTGRSDMTEEINCDRCPAELPEDFFGVAYIATGDSVERICSDCHDELIN